MAREVSLHLESWATRIPFRISGHTWNEFVCVVCEIAEDGKIGRGQGEDVYYCGETDKGMLEALEMITPELERGIDRAALQELLPPGGARNAADSALWDLEAQLTGKSAWEMAGVSADPVETVFTIGLEAEPETMGQHAAEASHLDLFKIKLNADRPVERIAAIRKARPDARLVIDANQGWTFEQLVDVAPKLAELGVSMIEQPLPRGGDDELEGYKAPVPLCADESCLHMGELEQAAGRYQMINIKLDKAGGLTHSLELAAAARDRGLGLMVGCMGHNSWSMAPAHVLAQLCDFVDIDGPLLMKNDCIGGLVYDGSMVSLPKTRFWGMP